VVWGEVGRGGVGSALLALLCSSMLCSAPLCRPAFDHKKLGMYCTVLCSALRCFTLLTAFGYKKVGMCPDLLCSAPNSSERPKPIPNGSEHSEWVRNAPNCMERILVWPGGTPWKGSVWWCVYSAPVGKGMKRPRATRKG
jgi:hypothetical protein